MANGILIVAETLPDGEPAPATRELFTAAHRLAQQARATIAAVVCGAAPASAAAWAALGADTVYCVRDGTSDDWLPEARLAAVAEAARREAPLIVLGAHAIAATELAPRLGFRLNGSVATGCNDIAIEQGKVRCTRPCYGGVVREEAEYAAPVVATLRAGIFERAQPQPGREAKLVELGRVDAASARIQRVERRTETDSDVRLEDARVIVAGGRGLEGPEGFEVLAELARELGGAVGASRVPCDLGWCPHSWQIGLTGKTVTPELYIAVGISGAGHHMAGCGNSKAIVAINSDPEAAIFEDARFGVIGDYRSIVTALIEQLRR